ncbi:hypothetical protein ACLBKW_05810 [Bacillus altitudinis]|uniref:UPF0738 protein ABQG71_06595 n=1 Tax=Bacillus altitudinis TaxID=293387 RepID=A0ABV1S3N5_BACAB|nr:MULTISPECIES: hypothetical protein [Bacillus]KAJ0072564.1 hypothetical protein DBB48_010760 [Bacillus altitudinis]MCL4098653.1 hypothetical protein [Bacillus altitudinis]MCM3229491.1 hypothetical protein [Bacillus altitudinis]MEC1181126.1 hypothetical protein [Bacillus altitudinis]TYO51763.1 hypothetical protein FXF70_10810 [Bacillus sp. Y3]
MQNRIEITEATLKEDRLILTVQSDEQIQKAKASGQMLVDSDHFAFVYILETEESFTYLILGEHTWAPLKEAMNLEIPVYLAAEEQTLELIQLHQELNYLIDNIKDNANYGDMEEKVKSTFL